MRSQVSVLGMFQGMQGMYGGGSSARMEVIIKTSSQRCAYSGDLLEVRDAGAQYALEAAEMLQQRAPLGWAQARDGLQHRFVVAAGPLTPVSGDREAVRLVAHALDQPRCWRMRFRYARLGDALHEQAFLAGLAVRTLGHAHERDVAEAEHLQHLVYLADLDQATVDEQQIRRRDLTVANAGVTTLQCLPQRAVVIAGGHACDVEATVLLLQRSFGAEHDTRGYRALPARVADIEALDARGRLGQIQHLCERGEHFLHALLLRQPHAQRLGRVLLCQLDPLQPQPTSRRAHSQ